MGEDARSSSNGWRVDSYGFHTAWRAVGPVRETKAGAEEDMMWALLQGEQIAALLDEARAETRRETIEECRKRVYDVTVSHGDFRSVFCSDCDSTWPHGSPEEHTDDCILAPWRWMPSEPSSQAVALKLWNLACPGARRAGMSFEAEASDLMARVRRETIEECIATMKAYNGRNDVPGWARTCGRIELDMRALLSSGPAPEKP